MTIHITSSHEIDSTRSGSVLRALSTEPLAVKYRISMVVRHNLRDFVLDLVRTSVITYSRLTHNTIVTVVARCLNLLLFDTNKKKI